MTVLSLTRFKRCTKCGCTKSFSEFHKCQRCSGGVKNHCKRCVKLDFLAYQEKNAARIKSRWKEYYQANKEYLRARAREYGRANREEILQRERAWRAQNPEAAKKRYRRKNTSVAGRAKTIRRRGRERAARASMSAEEVWGMIESQDHLCAFCETPLFGEYHIDHLLPLSRGGTSHWDNLAITCPECNYRKSSKTAVEFWHYLQSLK